MHFYKNYVRLCNSIGKTPSAVATEIGIEKSTVTRWKKGGSANYATQQKIADYFGCTTEDLLKDLDTKKDAEAKKDTPAEAVMSMRDLMMRMSRDELLTLISDAADILRNK